jgi:hypothetical protein
MEIGKEELRLCSTQSRKLSSVFFFLFSIFLSLLLASCASPGEPIERRPPVPTAITDLAAQQSGNTVVLTFTLPRETVQHRPLKQPPSIEILRSLSAARPSGTLPPQSSPSATPLVTIPSGIVDRYTEQGHIRYVDALQPNDFADQPHEVATYIVRTRASQKRSSLDSNPASLPIYPMPDPIDDLKAQIGRANTGISLSWTPPQKTPVGPAPAIRTYRIYRVQIATPGEENQKSAAPAPAPSPGAEPIKLKQQFTQIAESLSLSYVDEHTEFGKTYAYVVRSVVQCDNRDLESSDSNSATITMRDVYPPSAPQGLVAVFVPKLGETPAHLELSWAINPETDVAGYNVYRSEQRSTLGTRLNPDLLLTPAFRDTSAVTGRAYFYQVSAVDRSGNESSPSAPVAAEMPAESQQQP